jgi:threonine dehydratase
MLVEKEPRNQVVAATDNLLNLNQIEEAREVIKKYARRTPLVKSMFLSNNVVHGDVYLKLENMQLTGSFKFRGRITKLTT